MNIVGNLLIGQCVWCGIQGVMYVIDVVSGECMELVFGGVIVVDFDEVCVLVWVVFDVYCEILFEVCVQFFEVIVVNIFVFGDVLVECCVVELGLLCVCVEGECGCIVGQLCLFVGVVCVGDYFEVCIDLVQLEC